MKPKVGFIGLGTLGKPMAWRLLESGYPLTIYNRTRSRMDELVALGASGTGSPREVAQSADIVLTCLFDESAVLDVILGARGVIEGVREGSIVVEMSTISPLIVRRLAEPLHSRGAKLLDAPITRGWKRARTGDLAIMVGGERAVFEQCRSVFETLGKYVFYMGESGMGALAKVVNNLLVFIHTAAIAEAFALGVKGGVEARALFEAISVGSGDSYQVQQRVPHILKGDFDPAFASLDLAYKDVDVATSLGKQLQVPLPLGNTAQQLYEAGRAAGLGDREAGAVICLYERLLGIQVRDAREKTDLR